MSFPMRENTQNPACNHGCLRWVPGDSAIPAPDVWQTVPPWRRASLALRAAPFFKADFDISMTVQKPNPFQSDASVAGLSPSCEQPAQLKIPTVRRAAKTFRQLTPQKVGVAWEKVRRVVRDLCRQRGPECPLCRPYGGRIEFQLTVGHRPITLDLDGHRIIARMGRRRWAIRIVRIKTGGSGYELRRKILTATSMLIELLLEARQLPEITRQTAVMGPNP